MKSFINSVIKQIGYIFAGIVILLGLLVFIAYVITPILDNHKTDFEKYASQLLQTPVTIKKVHVGWYGYQPNINLDSVILRNSALKPISEIEEVSLLFSLPRSLWHFTPVLSGVTISGTSVSINQGPDHTLVVQGFPSLGQLEGTSNNESRFKDVIAWISIQPDLLLRHIELHYTDINHKKSDVTLSQLAITNSGSSHFLKGDVLLKQAIPTEIKLSLLWNGVNIDLKQMKAQLYVYVTGLSLPQWLQNKSWNGWTISQGIASAKIWGTWNNGAFEKIQTTLQAFNLSLYSQKDKSSHFINRLSGNFGWKHDTNQSVIAGDDVLIDWPSHLWPVNNFYASLYPNGSLQTLNLGYLDLADVKPFLDSFDLPKNITPWFDHTKIAGNLENVAITFQNEDVVKNSFTAQFNQLSCQSWQQFPGFNNLSGQIKWNGESGEILLASKQASIDYPRIFLNPINLNQLASSVELSLNSEQTWQFNIPHLQMANNDVVANVQATLTIPAKATPSINLNANFSMQKVDHITDYLPMKIFDADLVEWLHQAFLSGTVQSGRAILQGKLSDFPFDKGPGLFQIQGDVNQVSLRYAPEWPLLQNVKGKINFTGRKMLVDVDHAQLQMISVPALHAEIPYIGDAQPQFLNIQSQMIQTDIASAMHFVHASPLEKTIGKLFTDVELTGPMSLNLGLTIPLKKPENTAVQGDLSFNQVQMNLVPWQLHLNSLIGQLHFTQDSITAKSIQGQLLNQKLSFNLESLKKNNKSFVRSHIETTLAMSDVEKWLKIPLSAYLKGQTTVKGMVDFSLHEPMEIQLQSNLIGLQVNLPGAYGKPTQESKYFATDIFIKDNKPLRTKVTYNNVDLILSSGNNQWNLSLTSPDIRGTIQSSLKLDHTGWLKAQFDHLNLQGNDLESSVIKINPKTLPRMSIDASGVKYHNIPLGRITFATSPTSQGLAIDTLRIHSSLMDLDAKGSWSQSKNTTTTFLEGKAISTRVSDLLTSFGLDVRNFITTKGTILFDLNWRDVPYAPSLTTLNGTAKLDLGQGRIADIGPGNGAKMGIAQLLNIFSLQTIPRRLAFDFSDVFQKGYSFDHVRGDFTFENGIAHTTNFTFDGTVAKVGIGGYIGLKNKDLDFTLVVTPYFTSSIPVAATILTLTSVVNPIVGLGAFAVNSVLGSQFSKANTYYYEVTGPWNHPVWKSVKVLKRK